MISLKDILNQSSIFETKFEVRRAYNRISWNCTMLHTLDGQYHIACWPEAETKAWIYTHSQFTPVTNNIMRDVGRITEPTQQFLKRHISPLRPGSTWSNL